MRPRRDLLEAIAVARRRGVALPHPYSEADLVRVYCTLRRMKIGHNMVTESSYKRLIKRCPRR